MNVGEVSLLTSDVVRMASFYRAVLKIEGESDDNVHQFIIPADTVPAQSFAGTSLTVYNDGTPRDGNYNNICIAFTVESVDEECERLKALGVEIAEPPTERPWGAKNMSFKDPDGNIVVFRSFPGGVSNG